MKLRDSSNDATIWPRRIMVVDDDQAVVGELRRCLSEALSCIVEVAYNGKEAFDRLVDQPPDSYAVGIMEILIPKLNGIEVCEMLSHDEHLRQINVLLMSELPLRSVEFQRSLRQYNEFSVVSGVLEKPLDEQKLLDQVRQVLQNREPIINKLKVQQA